MAIREMDDAAQLTERARRELSGHQKVADEARARLEEHIIRRRVLERLEARAQDAHAFEAARKAHGEMDELALRSADGDAE